MLQRILAGKPLEALIQTDILRHRRVVSYRDSVLECALDEGDVRAAGRVEAILELEIELIRGSEDDLQAYADEVLAGYSLIPEDRSKLARGMALLEKDDKRR